MMKFLRENLAWWLTPIVVVMVLVGWVLWASKDMSLDAFIYDIGG